MKNKFSSLVRTTLTLGILTSTFAQAHEATPGSMAAMGDSITAGALAGFTRTDGHNPAIIGKFFYYLGKIGYKGSLNAIAVPERSWSTGMGNRVRSHARRLNEMANLEGYNLGIYNAAVSGTNSNNLMEQTNAVINWSSKYMSTKGPDYVTIAMGANDACTQKNEWMTPASTYGNNLRNAVFKILDTNRNSKVMISGIPNLLHLKAVAKDSLLMGVPPLTRCQQMWETVQFCNNVLVEKDPAKVAEVGVRLKEYLEEIKDVTAEANERFGADRVRNALNVYDYKFTDGDISVDCFHPNWKGQNILSNETWKRTWWAKDKW